MKLIRKVTMKFLHVQLLRIAQKSSATDFSKFSYIELESYLAWNNLLPSEHQQTTTGKVNELSNALGKDTKLVYEVALLLAENKIGTIDQLKVQLQK